MALEREKTNVSIGNMPIVQPSGMGALANVAKNMQQDFAKERQERKDDNDRMEIADKKAMIFDTLTNIKLKQETPNSSQFGLDAGKQIKRIINSAQNAEQRTALTIASSQISSSFINSIAQTEAIYNSDIAMEESQQHGVNAVDIHRALPADQINNKDAVSATFAEIDEHAAAYMKNSMGRITPEKARKYARGLKTEIMEKIAFTNYMRNVQSLGKKAADAELTKEATAWAKTKEDEMSFRQSVRRELGTLEISEKLRKLYASKMDKFEKATLAQQKTMLPQLEGEVPAVLFEKAQSIVTSGEQIMVDAGMEASIREELEGATTEAEVGEIQADLKVALDTPKQRAMLIKLASQKRVSLMRYNVIAQEKAETERVNAIKEEEIQNKLDKIAAGEDIDFFYSDGVRITEKGAISRLRGAIRTAKKAQTALDGWNGLYSPPPAVRTGINNKFNKEYGQIFGDFLTTGNPQAAQDMVKFVNTAKMVPSAITDAFAFDQIRTKSPNEINHLAALFDAIDTNQNKNADVVQSLANIDPKTRVFLAQYRMVADENKETFRNNYNRQLQEAELDPDKMQANKIAAEIIAPAPDGEYSFMETSFVNYVNDSWATDVWKEFSNWLTRGLNIITRTTGDVKFDNQNNSKLNYFDLYMRRTQPSLFLNQNRGFLHGLKVAALGIDEGDVALHVGNRAKKFLSNQAAKLHIESGGAGDKNIIGKMAWERTSKVVGYSALMKPTMDTGSDDDKRVVQAYIPELTSSLAPHDTAIVMIESAHQAWQLSSKEEKKLFEFLGTEYYHNGKLDFGKLFHEGRLKATDPLPTNKYATVGVDELNPEGMRGNRIVLHKLMIKDDQDLWKSISNFSSDNVAASDYFNLDNPKILLNRSSASRYFDGSGD